MLDYFRLEYCYPLRGILSNITLFLLSILYTLHKLLTKLLGFPPEFQVTVYVRKLSGNFFHCHYGKGSGISERFFSVNRKFCQTSLAPTQTNNLTYQSNFFFNELALKNLAMNMHFYPIHRFRPLTFIGLR